MGLYPAWTGLGGSGAGGGHRHGHTQITVEGLGLDIPLAVRIPAGISTLMGSYTIGLS